MPGISSIILIVTVFTLFQGQDPILKNEMDHKGKLLSITNKSFTLVSINIYAIRYTLNETEGLIEKDNPIDSLSTQGFIAQGFILWPFEKKVIDLELGNNLKYLEWDPAVVEINKIIDCFAISSRNYLSNKTNIYTVLTPTVKFPVSVFGPISQYAGIGGGYETTKFLTDFETQLSDSCKKLYKKY